MLFFSFILYLATAFYPAYLCRIYGKYSPIPNLALYLAVSFPIVFNTMKALAAFILISEELESGLCFAYFMESSRNLIIFLSILLIAKLAARVKQVNRFIGDQSRITHKKTLVLTSFFLIFLGVISLTFVANSSFGVFNWVLNPRDGYQFHRAGYGLFFSIFVNCIAISSAFLVLSQTKLANLFFLMLLLAPITYLGGMKLALVSIFLLFCFQALILRKKRKFGLIAVVSPLMLLPIFLNFFSSSIDGSGVIAILNYFDYFLNSALFYETYLNGKFELFGGRIWWSSYLSYLPSFFFADLRPDIYGPILVNEHFWPGLADRGHFPSFTQSVYTFADFGVIGVLLSVLSAEVCYHGALVYGIIRGLVPTHPAMIIFLGMNLSPAFGSFLPEPIFLISTLLLIYYLKKVKLIVSRP